MTLRNLSIRKKLYLSYSLIIILLLITISTSFIFTQNSARILIIGSSLILVLSIVAAVYITQTISIPLVNLSKLSQEISQGNFDVNIESTSNDEIGQLSQSFSLVLATLNQVLEETDSISSSALRGLLHSRANDSRFTGGFKEIVNGLNTTIDSFVGHINALPVSVVISDTDFNIQYTNTRVSRFTGKEASDLVGDKFIDTYKYEIPNFDDYSTKKAFDTGKHASQIARLAANGKMYDVLHESLPLVDDSGNIVGILDILQDQTKVITAQRDAEEQSKVISQQMEVVEKRSAYHSIEVAKLLDNLDQLSKGNLDIHTSIEEPDEDTKEIAENYFKINDKLEISTSSIKSYIVEISEVLGEMANKNLTITIDREYVGDFESLKTSLNYIIGEFNEIISDITTVSIGVESGADQVTTTSQNLSQGSAEQASAIEQISATVTEITEQTKENASNAQTANSLATKSKESAELGNSQMTEMLSAMNEIKESSMSVLNIIKAIDEIAFQTNILALNAAVEAARAGEHGRGFAVVAEEVRSLAARSAEASKETTELINNSIAKVDVGYGISKDTANALEEIASGITAAVEVIGGIAEASNQQAIAVEEIQIGLEEITSVTQNISSNAEEAASVSEEMLQQANSMKTMTSAFLIK